MKETTKLCKYEGMCLLQQAAQLFLLRPACLQQLRQFKSHKVPILELLDVRSLVPALSSGRNR